MTMKETMELTKTYGRNDERNHGRTKLFKVIALFVCPTFGQMEPAWSLCSFI